MTTTVAEQASPIRVDAPLPSASAIRSIADDVIAQVKYSFTSQAAGIAPKTPGQIDKAAAAFMASRDAKSRAQYQAKAQATLALPVAERTHALGRFAGITSYTGSDELHKLVPMAKLDAHTLETQFKAFAADLTHKPKAKKGDPGLKYKKLRLLIDSVHCIEETSGLLEGSDEIALGGTATGPRGKTVIIPQFMVSNDFDEGETVNYTGGKRIVTWDIDRAKDWPHVYGAVIAMSEKDDGGFGDWLKALWDGVSAKVKQAISSAVAGGLAAALGAALGGVIGALAGPDRRHPDRLDRRPLRQPRRHLRRPRRDDDPGRRHQGLLRLGQAHDGHRLAVRDELHRRRRPLPAQGRLQGRDELEAHAGPAAPSTTTR